MNYLTNLTNDQKLELCKLIGGDLFKIAFRQSPKQFNKIKPGFRPESISPDAAVTLAAKNTDTQFISSFINSHVEGWMKEIEEYKADKIKEGLNDESASIITLSKSVFYKNPALYYILIGENLSDPEIINKMELIEKAVEEDEKAAIDSAMDNGQEEADMEEIIELRNRIADLESEVSRRKSELEEVDSRYKKQLHELEVDIESLTANLATTTEEKLDLQNTLSKATAELKEFKSLARYDDSSVVENLKSEFDHISLCEVTESDIAGQDKILVRLADISSDGQIRSFVANDNIEKMYDNRDWLFYREGPTTIGSVAVYEWSARQNRNTPSRDYVEIKYNNQISPVEVIFLQACDSLDGLKSSLKTGIDVQMTSNRALFSIAFDKGKSVGLLCDKNDLEITAEGVKLKGNINTLPKYSFNKSELAYLGNNHKYIKQINLGLPSEVVRMQNPLEIVRQAVLRRSTWNLLKQQGKTRNDARTIREFIEGLDVNNVLEEISKECLCSQDEANEYLDSFISLADKYINGETIEDSIIDAVLSSNESLLKKCKDSLRSDWEIENSEIIERAREIENGINEKQEQYDELKVKYDKLVTDYNNKIQLAVDVESQVANRISKAKKDAASFISEMAFVSPSSNMLVTSNPIDTDSNISCKYIMGLELDRDEMDEISDWEDVLDTLRFELEDAGVSEKYSEPLASYMYSAFLLHEPLLVVGPNAPEIIDALSATMFGRTADVIRLDGEYDSALVESALNGIDSIIRIDNPLANGWISRLPEILRNKTKYIVATYPYLEDIVIEPNSYFSYFLPIFSDLFVEKQPTGEIHGGYKTDRFKDFEVSESTNNTYNALFSAMGSSLLVSKKIQRVIANMHKMNDSISVDDDVSVVLAHFAFATSKMSVLWDSIDSSERLSNALTKERKDEIQLIFGK